MDIKFCKDCKYFVLETENPLIFDQCANPSVLQMVGRTHDRTTYMVTGKLPTPPDSWLASQARLGKCGKEAKFWEAIEL